MKRSHIFHNTNSDDICDVCGERRAALSDGQMCSGFTKNCPECMHDPHFAGCKTGEIDRLRVALRQIEEYEAGRGDAGSLYSMMVAHVGSGRIWVWPDAPRNANAG